MLEPQITVNGFTGAVGSYGIIAGGESFSQGNGLNQDIWELTDDFTFPVGLHRVTIGTRNEPRTGCPSARLPVRS